MRSESLNFLKAVVEAPSPSGYEQPVARLYRDYVSRFADRVATDVIGNVSAALNPDAAVKVMLAGHMDEIGFTVHYVSEEGLLHFRAIGGHDSVIPVGQRVWVHGRERVAGVIGHKAIHLLDQDELKAKPKMSDLWIDVGTSSRAEVEAVVGLGDVATFQHGFQPLLGGRATA